MLPLPSLTYSSSAASYISDLAPRTSSSALYFKLALIVSRSAAVILPPAMAFISRATSFKQRESLSLPVVRVMFNNLVSNIYLLVALTVYTSPLFLSVLKSELLFLLRNSAIQRFSYLRLPSRYGTLITNDRRILISCSVLVRTVKSGVLSTLISITFV